MGAAAPTTEAISAPADTAGILLAGLRGATAFCVTPSGAVYLLEAPAGRIVRYSPGGKAGGEAGGYGWGGSGFDRPTDIDALNDLEIFVADEGNDRVVRLDPSLGLVSMFETRSGDDPFRSPLGVAATAGGKLLVVDGENGRIIEIGPDDRILRTFGGTGTGAAFLRRPVRVRSDGHHRVLVRHDRGIAVFDAWGNFLATLGTERTGRFIAFDHHDGGVALLDSHSVRLLDPAGMLRVVVPIPAGLRDPGGVPVDIRSAGGWLYVLYPDRLLRLRAAPAPPPAEDPGR